jgi:hypothetical protein
LGTTVSTNVGIPSIGNFGGNGDKLILYPGTNTTYPNSIGIESNYSLWMSSPKSINFYNNGINSLLIDVSGNVGIGTATVNTKLHLEHSSTAFNAANGGLYLYNPNNTANNCSVLGARIGGSTANKAGISLDVNGNYGWSIYINGNDTTDKWLRFNSSWDGSGSERLQIRGSDGYTNINGGLYRGQCGSISVMSG